MEEEEFSLPEDLTGVEDLDALLAEAVAAFDELSGRDTITADDLERLRQLRDDIRAIETEQTGRVEAAEAAAAEIDALRNEVHGEDETDDAEAAEGDEGGEGGEGDGPDEGGEGEGGEPPSETAEETTEDEVVEGELVTAAARPRPLNVGAIRQRQPAQRLPEPAEEATPGVTITAAADVPGFATGELVDFDSLVNGVTTRARGLASGKRPGASALIASYEMPFAEHLQVNDPGSAVEGSRALTAAADQSHLPGGDLAASGGWCAPSETLYDIVDVACPEMLWDAPEIQLNRGGIRFFQTPSLDVSQLTWTHTEAQDIAGAEKPCFAIPCPDPIEVRCDAVGVCLESGILTERHFPELVSWYVRNSMVAHEMRISQSMFLGAIAASTNVDGTASAAAFTAVFGQVALRAADMVERHSLCERIAVEVTFPWWARNLFLTDIARQNGRDLSEVDPAVINRAFATLGVNVQWARGLAPTVPTDIGGTDPAAAWPAEVPFLLHPTGAFQIGRGAEVNLGAVYDSEKFKTNDYTALFTEECVALVNRGPESQFVTVPVCPDGSTGAQFTDVDCPIDAGTVVS